MPECPNCNQYYFGTPAECPNCHKKLPVSKPAPKPAPKPTPTLSYGSIREKQNNIGNVVQTLAGIDLVINAIATIICAIAFGRDHWGDFSFGSFILILLVGFIASAIAFIMLYAFGRLVESSIQTAENTEASLKYLNQIAQTQEKDVAGNE